MLLSFCCCVSDLLPSLRLRMQHLTTSLSPCSLSEVKSSSDKGSELLLLWQHLPSYVLPGTLSHHHKALWFPMTNPIRCLAQAKSVTKNALRQLMSFLISPKLILMELCLPPNLIFHSLPKYQNSSNCALLWLQFSYLH